MKSRILTLTQLYQANACMGYYNKFERIFGKEVVLTKKIARKYGASFPSSWAARHLLRKNSSLKRFEKKCQKLNAKYFGSTSRSAIKKFQQKTMVVFAKLYIAEGK